MEHKTVSALLEVSAEKYPDKTALIFQGKSWSYSELNTFANKIATWLISKGIQPGQRVAICGNNSDNTVAGIFGILKARGVAVPLHPKVHPSKLEYVLRDCTPTAVMLFDCDEALYASAASSGIANVVSDQPIAVDGAITWDQISNLAESGALPEASIEDVALIIYTSGSTKDPRGVVSRNRQILFAENSINQVILNTFDDRVLCGIPLSFDYGLYQVFLTFQVGATIVLEKPFAFPTIIPTLINRYEITGFPGVPSLFASLLQTRVLEKTPVPSLRYICSTGDVFPAAHIKRLVELLPQARVIPMYGLTECKRVCIMPNGKLTGHESSVGWPIPGTQVIIADDDGKELRAGEIGELVVRGPHLMDGYWNNKVETDLKYGNDPVTGERILRSGDKFRKDAEGFLYYVSRSDTMIKSAGFRVSSAAIEAVLCNLPGVYEAGVVGRQVESGEKIVAFVFVDDSLTIPQVQEWCRNQMSPEMQPHRIILMQGPLPKTDNGKINRLELKALANQMVEPA